MNAVQPRPVPTVLAEHMLGYLQRQRATSIEMDCAVEILKVLLRVGSPEGAKNVEVELEGNE